MLPAAQTAAHQAVYGLWVLLSYTSVPLEQAALSFVPQSRPGEHGGFLPPDNMSALLLHLLPLLTLQQPAQHTPAGCMGCPTSLTTALLTGTQERRETMSLIVGMAVALGLVTGPMAGLLPALLPSAFTADPALWPLMRSVSLQVRLL